MEEVKQDNVPTSTAKEINVPEWEHNATAADQRGPTSNHFANTFGAARSRFNGLMPAHKRYCRMSRRVFLLVVLATFLALLALIIGLAVGLTKQSQYVANIN